MRLRIRSTHQLGFRSLQLLLSRLQLFRLHLLDILSLLGLFALPVHAKNYDQSRDVAIENNQKQTHPKPFDEPVVPSGLTSGA